MEILELADHPYFLAVQYHPEFLSRPLRPAPVFFGFILAACGKLDGWMDHRPSTPSVAVMPEELLSPASPRRTPGATAGDGSPLLKPVPISGGAAAGGD